MVERFSVGTWDSSGVYTTTDELERDEAMVVWSRFCSMPNLFPRVWLFGWHGEYGEGKLLVEKSYERNNFALARV